MSNNITLQNIYNNKPIENSIITNTNNFMNDLQSKMLSNKIINNNNIKYNNNETLSQNYPNWNDLKKPELYYDNLKDDGKKEIITQNLLSFDSTDRDINIYPNPFNYKIKFNPSTTSSDAYILKNYKNIRYLSLEYIILPRRSYILKKDISNTEDDLSDINNLINDFDNITNNKIYNNFIIPEQNSTNNIIIIDKYKKTNNIIVFSKLLDKYTNMEECWEIEFNTDLLKINYYYLSNYKIENDKYLLLNLKEINNNYNYSTNKDIQNSFGILLPNLINGDFFYLDTDLIEKIYKYSDLGNIEQLTINILNSRGITIDINKESIDNNVTTSKKCICNSEIRYYNCSCTYFRHILYHKFQSLVLFKIGYIEPDIDKNVY